MEDIRYRKHYFGPSKVNARNYRVVIVISGEGASPEKMHVRSTDIDGASQVAKSIARKLISKGSDATVLIESIGVSPEKKVFLWKEIPELHYTLNEPEVKEFFVEIIREAGESALGNFFLPAARQQFVIYAANAQEANLIGKSVNGLEFSGQNLKVFINGAEHFKELY